MDEPGSKVASYMLCLVLAVPLVLLGLIALGWNGLLASFVAVAVTSGCVCVVFFGRRRTLRSDG